MGKTYKVLLTDIALENLETIPPKLIEKILEKADLLEAFPELGYAVQKQNWSGYRLLIVEDYRVIYTIDDARKLVIVHFIKHGKMNFQ